MEFKAFFVLVLIFFLVLPTQAAVINPSVESQNWICRYSVTKWICGIGGEKGTINLPDNINITQFISNFQNSTFSGNVYNNSTIWYSNLTDPVFNGDVNYFQYSEMNQTPNMTSGPAGPQGPPGPQGETGPMNLTANMTAGPMNMTANMTAGPKGDTGAQGPAGDKGDKGDTGAQGPPGAANMTAGPQGEQGPQGIQGIQGVQGEQGPTGPMNQTPNMTAGPQGIQGINGTPGMDANVSTMWPVNSVYITTSTSSPAMLLGAGSWSSIYNQTVIPYSGNFIPTMGAQAIPAGYVATAISYYAASYDPWKVFDHISYGSTGWFWASANTAGTKWLMIQLPSNHTINKYTIFPGDVIADSPQNWTLNCSSGGGAWTTIDTRTMQTGWTAGNGTDYSVSTLTSCDRFNFTITRQGASNICRIGEVYFYDGSDLTTPLYYWRRTS